MLKSKLLFPIAIIIALQFGLFATVFAYTRYLVNSTNFAFTLQTSSQQGNVLINKTICNTKPCLIGSHTVTKLAYLYGVGNQLSGSITLQCVGRCSGVRCTIQYGKSSSDPVVTNFLRCTRTPFRTLDGNISITNFSSSK